MDDKEKRSKEEKKEKGTGVKVSRRSFLKGMGAGALATAMTSLPTSSLPEAEAALPAGLKEAVIQLNVNDRVYRLKVKSHWTLLDVLRRELGLTGTKKACNHGNCGACTVLVDGEAVYACSLLAMGMEGRKILTVEGLRDGDKLHPIQKAFSEHGGYQCGYCTSGQMMAAKALLDKNLKPSREEVRRALAGNLCRCGAYPTLSRIATDLYRKVAEEKKIEPLGEPVLTDIDYKRGEELRFKVKFEIKPKFELGKYTGIPVERMVHTVTDQEVENELRRLQKANSTLSEVPSAADDEHVVTVDVQDLDPAGTPLIGRKSINLRVYLADETVHPEVRNALRVVTVGELRRAAFETERDGNKNQHHIECTVTKVEKVSFPDLDDPFAKKLTKDKVQTLADFRRQIRTDLAAYWQEMSERSMMDAIIGEIVRRHDFVVPESLIKAITDGSIEELRNEYPNKKLPKDFDEQKFREEYRASSIFQAKWYLIRERIVETENIKVDDADLQHRAELDAPSMGIEKERLTAFYKNSQTVVDKIASQKLTTFLKANATITDKITDTLPQ